MEKLRTDVLILRVIADLQCQSVTTDKIIVRLCITALNHALIASRLDYCNSVFYQLSAANLQALQSVFNAGAPLIMRKWKYDHIT